METLSKTLSPLQRKRTFKGYTIRQSNSQLSAPRGDQSPFTGRQASKVIKARASSKGIVLRFTKGKGQLDRYAASLRTVTA